MQCFPLITAVRAVTGLSRRSRAREEMTARRKRHVSFRRYGHEPIRVSLDKCPRSVRPPADPTGRQCGDARPPAPGSDGSRVGASVSYADISVIRKVNLS